MQSLQVWDIYGWGCSSVIFYQEALWKALYIQDCCKLYMEIETDFNVIIVHKCEVTNFRAVSNSSTMSSKSRKIPYTADKDKMVDCIYMNVCLVKTYANKIWLWQPQLPNFYPLPAIWTTIDLGYDFYFGVDLQDYLTGQQSWHHCKAP